MDWINAMFGVVTAVTLLCNIIRIKRDGSVSGVSPIPTIYFVMVGIWSVIFHLYNGMVVSACVSSAPPLINICWLGYYLQLKRKS